MLSRTADAVYWLNRYVERADNLARFLDVNLSLGLEVGDEPGTWEALLATTASEEDYEARYGEVTRENVLRFMTTDASNPNSILSSLYQARENARSVREVISSEMWEQANRAYLFIKDASSEGLFDERAVLERVKMDSHLFVGLSNATMSHGEAWHFGVLGRALERADKTARMLDVKYFILLPTQRDVGGPLDDLQWGAVLRSASALEMYRKKQKGGIKPWRVIEFLVLDREFPRSIRYCVGRAEQALNSITGSQPGTFQNRAEKRLGQLRGEFDYAEVADVFAEGLHEFLQDVLGKLNRVGDAVSEAFFALKPAALSASPSTAAQ